MKLELTAKNWFSNNNVAVRGFCFSLDNKLHKDEKLLEYFSQAIDNETFINLLQQANGIFAVIINFPHFKAIAIDGTRIYPIYYSVDNQIVVTDDPHLLLNANSKIDATALEEYNISANVFEGKTLINNIKQVKPFHYIIFEKDKENQVPYWQYCIHRNTEKELTISQLDKFFETTFRRLLASVADRMFVVPLTGGLDSRLIVCWLKKLGVENVVCYTVGRPQNAEYLVAKQVAEKLGYKYILIDNTSAEFVPVDFYKDADFIKYCNFIGNFSNFSWVFEYFAVKYLKEKAIIEKDAVFVPGHSADFIAGSHLCKANITPQKSISYLTNSIMCDSFEYFKYSKSVYKTVKGYFSERKNMSVCTNYLSFILQNRLAHQINNSARVYEFFDLEVRLPFWDIELLDAFKSLPYKQLANCNFYRKYVNEVIFKQYDLVFPIKTCSRKQNLIQKFKNRIKFLLPKKFLNSKSLAEDIICEKELTMFMREELAKKNKVNFCSYNDIMKQWYLENLLEILEKGKIKS